MNFFKSIGLGGIANILSGGTGGGANWTAANGYTNAAKGYLGQIDANNPRLQGMAGTARTTNSLFAPQAVKATQALADYDAAPMFTSTDDAAAIAQATAGMNDAYARNGDAIRENFATSGLTGSGSEIAAQTNNQIHRADAVAKAYNNRAMYKVAATPGRLRERAQVLTGAADSAQNSELGVIGVLADNAKYGAGVNLGLAQDSRQLAAQQDAQKRANQSALFGGAATLLAPLLGKRSVTPSVPAAPVTGYDLDPALLAQILGRA